jgi:hypothetical protein
MKNKKRQSITLSPLKFREAVADLLKVKPEPKAKSKAERKRK